MEDSADHLVRLKSRWSVQSCAESDSVDLEGSSRLSVVPLRGFHQLYRNHFDRILRLILRFGIKQVDAEDIAQRVFMVAYQKLESGLSIECPEAWLRAVALRVIREHFRWWRVRKAAAYLLELSWADKVRTDHSPECDALANESLDQVRLVLCKMSDKLREALVLLDIEELTPREAAELLGVPQNTLRSRRALAREEFKRLWERRIPRPATVKGRS